MVSFGTHKAVVESIDPCRINISGELFDTSWVDHTEGEQLLVMFQFNRTFKLIERITPLMMDEITLRNQINPQFVVPATGIINSIFGPRRCITGIGDEFHEGIDISGKEGSPVYVIDTGTVCHVQEDEQTIYGYHIRVQHSSGLESVYAHLSQIQVVEGQDIICGQQVGLMGNTGKSSGPHLHLGLEYHGKYLNPRAFYPKNKMTLGQSVRALE